MKRERESFSVVWRMCFPLPSTGRAIKGERWLVSRPWFANVNSPSFPPLIPALFPLRGEWHLAVRAFFAAFAFFARQ